jgi:hypothetical protein
MVINVSQFEPLLFLIVNSYFGCLRGRASSALKLCRIRVMVEGELILVATLQLIAEIYRHA